MTSDPRPRLAVHRFSPKATPADTPPKTPVVLLHSGGMSSRQWRKFAAELSESREVYAPDFLGYGESPWTIGERFHTSLEILALERVLDEGDGPGQSGPAVSRDAATSNFAGGRERSGPFHLVGHSYGGAIAFLTALHRPAQVASIVAYEPPLFGVLDAAEGAVPAETVRAPALPVATVTDLEAWLRGFVDYWNAPGAWDAMPEAAKGSFRANGLKLFDEVQCLLGDRTPARTYATLPFPALLLCGEHSPVEARTLTDRIAAAMPQGRALRVPGAGHMGPITHAASVYPTITAFLDKVDATLTPRPAP